MIGLAQSAIAGLLLNAAFAPFNLWFCAPLSLTLLLHALHDRKFSQRLAYVFCFGTLFYLPLLSWSNTYVGATPWLLLVLLQTFLLFPIAIFPFSRRTPGKKWRTFLFPSLWSGYEWLIAHYPFGGFGWGRLGFSQADAPYSAFARFGGVPLLSFFTGLVAVVLFLMIQGETGGSARERTYARVIGGVLTVVVYLSLIGPSPLLVGQFSVVGVQGNVPKLGLSFNERAAAVFEKHYGATQAYFRRTNFIPDVVIWPENAVDIDPFEHPEVSTKLDALVNKIKVPLILGAVTDGIRGPQNESILWSKNRSNISRYVKQHLTPFGEYIPMRYLTEKVSPYAASVVDFSPGDTKAIHRVGQARIDPVLCYELLDDALGRYMVKGSNMVVVQTNNATFGLGAQSLQQLNITRIRAIEHQRFILSISTTGVSGFIDPQGKVSNQTSQNSTAVIEKKIGLISGLSMADKYGSTVEFMLIAPIFIMGLLTLVSSRRISIRNSNRTERDI